MNSVEKTISALLDHMHIAPGCSLEFVEKGMAGDRPVVRVRLITGDLDVDEKLVAGVKAGLELALRNQLKLFTLDVEIVG